MSDVLAETASPRAWLEAAHASLASVGATALGLEVGEANAVDDPTLAGYIAFIPVNTAGSAIQIGIVVDEPACRELSRALLQLDDPAEVALADMADALGEITNMIAGVAKATLAPVTGLITLGLPVVVHGEVAANRHLALDGLKVRVGAADVTLIIRHARSAG